MKTLGSSKIRGELEYLMRSLEVAGRLWVLFFFFRWATRLRLVSDAGGRPKVTNHIFDTPSLPRVKEGSSQYTNQETDSINMQHFCLELVWRLKSIGTNRYGYWLRKFTRVLYTLSSLPLEEVCKIPSR